MRMGPDLWRWWDDTPVILLHYMVKGTLRGNESPKSTLRERLSGWTWPSHGSALNPGLKVRDARHETYLICCGWLENGRGHLARNTRKSQIWEWPQNNFQQEDRDLIPAAARDWILPTRMSSEDDFTQSVQMGSPSSWHLDVSIVTPWA